ncbi:acyltransferase family protein [Spirosoma utsteinense]|uniref:Peptidoglycan/LPS O-acetylase OafA/YrhL n=1 Tax=Spirosoma utsteinense TaxID=2585773 RepID=A0ABR6W564_9BACT|nr:acyltransferase [Spirosoma utsteinense]MBC3785561.1 peptidoglycan/LPS O-acetylase OafA/YrhL [Spirosoma utsteinense]MBC3791709.1 peptidoglycan/LPS O-acetylase OafA/YrhL [Spirosoma utsteinense]
MLTTPTTTTTARPALNHLRQLDGIRFLAVAMVLFDHWMSGRVELPLGALGVTIFFVLSGFLITRILLASKDKLSNEPNGGLGKYMKTFYIRRTLRIFPVYYLTLFVLYAVNEPPVRRTFGWLALYATNLYMAYFTTWMGTVDHLWSLAVEEQVYLFFPLLLFLVPRRWVPATAILMIVGAVAMRYVLYRARLPWFIGYVTMPACLDSFGLGAIMAFWWLYQRGRFEQVFRHSIWIWVSCALLAVVVIYTKILPAIPDATGLPGHHNIMSDVWERLVASFIGFFLIGRAVLGFGGPMKWILEHPVSQYMGRISYGLYLYHNFVFNVYHTQPTHFTLRAWRRITDVLPFLNSSYFFQFSFFLAITITLATISWYLIERPVNNLKDRFSY